MPQTATSLSLGIIDASNCPRRMVFDDASRHIGQAVAHARRAFVREGKMAYVWRPPQPLRDEFRERAINETFWPMARSVSSWFLTKRSERTPQMISLGDSLGLPVLVRNQSIKDMSCQHQLEIVECGYPRRPYLLANNSNIMAGHADDSENYGCHSAQDFWPIHFDGLPRLMTDMPPLQRQGIIIRAVCIDQGQGTRLYDLSAHDLGGIESIDRGYERLKQSIVSNRPFLQAAMGDVLFIERGARSFRQCFIHAASPSDEVFIYDEDVPAEEFSRLRTVRTYDFTVPLNADDIRLQRVYWQNVLGV